MRRARSLAVGRLKRARHLLPRPALGRRTQRQVVQGPSPWPGGGQEKGQGIVMRRATAPIDDDPAARTGHLEEGPCLVSTLQNG